METEDLNVSNILTSYPKRKETGVHVLAMSQGNSKT